MEFLRCIICLILCLSIGTESSIASTAPGNQEQNSTASTLHADNGTHELETAAFQLSSPDGGPGVSITVTNVPEAREREVVEALLHRNSDRDSLDIVVGQDPGPLKETLQNAQNENLRPFQLHHAPKPDATFPPLERVERVGQLIALTGAIGYGAIFYFGVSLGSATLTLATSFLMTAFYTGWFWPSVPDRYGNGLKIVGKSVHRTLGAPPRELLKLMGFPETAHLVGRGFYEGGKLFGAFLASFMNNSLIHLIMILGTPAEYRGQPDAASTFEHLIHDGLTGHDALITISLAAAMNSWSNGWWDILADRFRHGKDFNREDGFRLARVILTFRNIVPVFVAPLIYLPQLSSKGFDAPLVGSLSLIAFGGVGILANALADHSASLAARVLRTMHFYGQINTRTFANFLNTVIKEGPEAFISKKEAFPSAYVQSYSNALRCESIFQ